MGKTVLACSATKPLLIEIDPEGADSLINHPNLYNETTVVECDSTVDFQRAIDGVARNKFPDRHTFIVDTITSLQGLDLYEMGQGVDRKLSRNEYGLANTNITNYLFKLLKLPINVIIIAHEREEKDEEVQSFFIRPDLQPRSYQKLLQLISCAFFLEKYEAEGKERRRLLTTGVSGRRAVKSRPAIKPKYLNPNWKEIEADIQAWAEKLQEGKAEEVTVDNE